MGVDRQRLIDEARRIKAPILISANSLRRKNAWRLPDTAGTDLAIDSGGFVAAMNGGFKFTMDEYLDLVTELQPEWFAAMDYCCEPEIAGDVGKVWQRIASTFSSMLSMNLRCKERRIPPPMPVLQGWRPSEYKWCVLNFNDYWYCDEPLPLLGVGSVCRRPLHGETGLFSIVETIDQWLNFIGKKHTKLHLFGVKGQAIEILRANWGHRIESTDSMAHAFRARMDCAEKRIPCTNDVRASFMRRWYERHNQSQLTMMLQ